MTTDWSSEHHHRLMPVPFAVSSGFSGSFSDGCEDPPAPLASACNRRRMGQGWGERKVGGQGSRPPTFRVRASSDHANVLSFLALRARPHVELDALTLFQVAVTLHVDSRVRVTVFD
jgi:hypothetical protein